MKILSKVLLWLFLFISLITLIFYYAFPKLSSDFGFYLRADAANLKSDKIIVNGNYINYYVGGNSLKKDTLLLLHGWGDNKNGFLKLAKYLSEDYYLIIPDLPGLGANEKSNKYDYNFKNQAKEIAILLDTFKVSKYHVVGISTGGMVSLFLALERPEELKSLILINTPYLQSKDSLSYIAFLAGSENDIELNTVLKKVYYQIPQFSTPVTNFLEKQVMAELHFLNTVILPNINFSDLDFLIQSLSAIQIPTLLLHSIYDNLVGVNDAAAYNLLLINSTYGTIPNTAHFPQYENPSALAGNITNFIGSHP